jgi:hypothetical protein
LIEEDNPDWSDLSHLLGRRWLWVPACAGTTRNYRKFGPVLA